MENTSKRNNYKSLGCVVEPELYNAIKELSKQNRYSMSDQIRAIIYDFLERQEEIDNE